MCPNGTSVPLKLPATPRLDMQKLQQARVLCWVFTSNLGLLLISSYQKCSNASYSMVNVLCALIFLWAVWHYFLTEVIYQSFSRLQFGLSVKKNKHTCLSGSCQPLTQVWPYCCFLRLEWLAERTTVLDLLFSKWQKIWYRDTQEFSVAFWPLSRGHLINTEKRRGKYIFFFAVWMHHRQVLMSTYKWLSIKDKKEVYRYHPMVTVVNLTSNLLYKISVPHCQDKGNVLRIWGDSFSPLTTLVKEVHNKSAKTAIILIGVFELCNCCLLFLFSKAALA